MRAGDLRHKITIQIKSLTPDGMGGSANIWVACANNISAAIWPVSGKERLQNLQLEAVVTHRIRIRWLPGIPVPLKPGVMQILFNSRVFNVQSGINWEERNVYIDMLCLEVIGAASSG